MRKEVHCRYDAEREGAARAAEGDVRVAEGRANSAQRADEGRGNAGDGEVAGGAGERSTESLDAGIAAAKRVGFSADRIGFVLERERERELEPGCFCLIIFIKSIFRCLVWIV